MSMLTVSYGLYRVNAELYSALYRTNTDRELQLLPCQCWQCATTRLVFIIRHHIYCGVMMTGETKRQGIKSVINRLRVSSCDYFVYRRQRSFGWDFLYGKTKVGKYIIMGRNQFVTRSNFEDGRHSVTLEMKYGYAWMVSSSGSFLEYIWLLQMHLCKQNTRWSGSKGFRVFIHCVTLHNK